MRGGSGIRDPGSGVRPAWRSAASRSHTPGTHISSSRRRDMLSGSRGGRCPGEGERKMSKRAAVSILLLVGAMTLGARWLSADEEGNTSSCRGLPSHAALRAALAAAQSQPNGGFALHMWGTVVNRDGGVCAVAFTGDDRGDQWPGSRVISAQKANTANAFSLPGLALSTANLYTAVQPGGSLFGLQESNPVNILAAYGGRPSNFGRANDPLVGERIGGINVFGGGLALYKADGTLVGGLGVSGDSSCADHNI